VEINPILVTPRHTTGYGCGCYTWFTDQKSVSYYRVVMILTVAAY
jgi:hypothetical protein